MSNPEDKQNWFSLERKRELTILLLIEDLKMYFSFIKQHNIAGINQRINRQCLFLFFPNRQENLHKSNL